MKDIYRNLLYFPTTTLVIDDDIHFSSTLRIALDNTISSKLCQDHQQAIDLLSKSPIISNDINNYMNNLKVSDNEIYLFKTTNKLSQLIYDPFRFENVSTLVIDYSLPNITGDKLCELIHNHPAKKIMLTGQADHEIAVNLFNAGLIDKFILKNSDSMINELNHAIIESQFQYFTEPSNMLANYMLLNNAPFYRDDAYWHFFNDIKIKNYLCEYYLLDNSGSFLALDNLGKPMVVLMKSVNEIDTYLSIAIDNDASLDIINMLRNREFLPFFMSEDELKTPINKWSQYLYKANKVQGVVDYYYSIVKECNNFGLDISRIVAHKQKII